MRGNRRRRRRRFWIVRWGEGGLYIDAINVHNQHETIASIGRKSFEHFRILRSMCG